MSVTKNSKSKTVIISVQCECGTMVQVIKNKSFSTKFYHVFRGICQNKNCQIWNQMVVYEQEKEILSELLV